MDKPTETSKNLILQYWGPIETLLKERFPTIARTAAQINELGKRGADAKLLADLRWMNSQRNASSHSPFKPIDDMARFRKLGPTVLRKLQDLRRKSGQRSAEATEEPQTIEPAVSREDASELDDYPEQRLYREPPKIFIRQVVANDPLKLPRLSLPHCSSRGSGRLVWTGTLNVCDQCGWSHMVRSRI